MGQLGQKSQLNNEESMSFIQDFKTEMTRIHEQADEDINLNHLRLKGKLTNQH